MKIGVCDWGVGGLGFFRLLTTKRPDLDVVYLGDQGVPGYGKLSRPVLTARIRSVLDEFCRRGVDRVVVACNAASTVLDPEDPCALGMILPTLRHLGSGRGTLGVIGGRRTILSGAYARPLRAAGWTVCPRIAQPLSGLIEAGLAHTPETLALLDTILRPLRGVEGLVLACTHYVVLGDAIRERLPGVSLIDPAALAWAELAPILPPPTVRRGTTRFLTTGDPSLMTEAALAAFGVACAPERTEIRP